jgi:thioredoxin reductase (NADPH)
MTRTPACEVVVGGGLAGLTTALYTTRLGHRTALVDREGGRYQSVASVHDLVGVSEDASGHDVSALAIDRLDQYGADVYRDGVREIEQVTKEFDGSDETADFENAADAAAQFRIVADSVTLRADRVMLATGFEDVPPRVRGLRRFVGRGLHYCLHCDAYTLGDEPVFVLGHSDLAAEVAMLMLNFTADVDLLPDDEESPWLGGLEFADGQRREYGGGFAVYSMEYDAELAAGLGCDLADDGAIEADENRETSVSGVYAVGDVTHGQNQTPIAIGDGATRHRALQGPPDVPRLGGRPRPRARPRRARDSRRPPGADVARP